MNELRNYQEEKPEKNFNPTNLFEIVEELDKLIETDNINNITNKIKKLTEFLNETEERYNNLLKLQSSELEGLGVNIEKNKEFNWKQIENDIKNYLQLSAERRTVLKKQLAEIDKRIIEMQNFEHKLLN